MLPKILQLSIFTKDEQAPASRSNARTKTPLTVPPVKEQDNASIIMGVVQRQALEALLAKWSEHFGGLPAPYVSIKLSKINVVWNHRMRSRAGLCVPSELLVELNPHILKTPAALEEVLIHEICHIVVSVKWPFAQSHGQKWQKLMKICGLNPNRCHSLEAHQRRLHRRWELHCPCKTHKVTTVVRNRIRRGIHYKCVECHELLFEKAESASS